MKIRKTSKTTSEVNLSSSSDIAFLLIIFFMVTSAFIFRDGIHMVLPSKAKKPQIVKDRDKIQTVQVNVDKITLNNKKVTIAGLEEKIKIALEKDADTVVLLKVHKDVRYQKMITVVDALKVVGAKKLSLRMM